MTRRVTLLLLALLTVHFTSLAQRCGFSAKHQLQMATNPQYAASVAAFETRWANYANSNPPSTSNLKIDLVNGDTVYEIPVVVHIIHTGGIQGAIDNPTNAMVANYLDYVNQAFAASFSGYPTPTSGGTRIPIRFTLAKRDTNCNGTSGIDRVNGSVLPSYSAGGVNYNNTGGENELNVKNLSRWNPGVYYNIWVVNKIDGNDGTTAGYTAGFTPMPTNTSPANLDGTVILATQLNPTYGGGPGNYALVHELGHGFNLYDIYEGDGTGSTCPTNTNCATDGDRICDTEPMKRSNSFCPSGTNPCTSNPYAGGPQNFMDYTSCADRFTAGQRQRMMYTLKSLITRSGFITSLGATAPSSMASATCFTFSNNPNNTFDVGVYDVIIADPSTVAASARDTFMAVTSDGYPGDGKKAYIDNTCRHRVSLITGRKYAMTVTVRNPRAVPYPTSSGSKARVYIDWNNNGSFEVAELTLDKGTLMGNIVKQQDFTVPSSAVLCTPLRMRVIVDAPGGGNPAFCGGLDYGQAEDYQVFVRGPGKPVVGTVVINNPPIGGNPSCFGTSLKFYAVPGTGLTVTGYKWLRNSVIIPGATTDTLTTNTLINNDTIKARIFFVTPCGIDSVVSNQDTIKRSVTVVPAVTIGLTAGAIPGCVDDTLVFSVTGTTNPGGAPTYVWQRSTTGAGGPYVTIPAANGIVNANGTSVKTFGNPTGTFIRAIMTSSAGSPCAIPATATSNTFQVTYTTKPPTVSIALTQGTNPGCAGLPVTITATPVAGGAAPTYVWRVNGVIQTGATTGTFTKVFNNGDQVNAVLTSNSPCASTPNATSETITIIQEQIIADVNIAVTSPGRICDGHNILFGATTINGGTNPNPTYQWRVNGTNVGGPQGPSASLTIVNHDMVTAIMMATDPCVANPLDTSNVLDVETEPSSIPSLSVNLTTGTNPGCIDSLLEFDAKLTDLGTGAIYTWYVNGFPAASGQTFSSSSLLDGDIVRVRAYQTDGQCYLPDTIFAKADTMIRSITLDPPVIHLVGNMLMTDRTGVFKWYSPTGEVPGEIKEQYYPSLVGKYFAKTDNRGCLSRQSNILDITLLDINTVDLSKTVRVYPNPTAGQLNLDWNGKPVNAEVTIYNQAGQSIITETVRNASQKTINLNGLADGNYFVVITDEQNKSGTIKIALHK